MDISLRNLIPQDWIIFVLLIAMALIAGTARAFGNRFIQFKELYRSNVYFTQYKKSPNVVSLFSLLLFLAHQLIASLGLFVLFKATDLLSTTYNFNLYLQILVIFAALSILKYLVEKITAVVFKIEPLIDNYIFYKITYRNLFSLYFIPLLFLLIYTLNYHRLISLICIGMMVLLQTGGLIVYYIKQQKSLILYWYYFILYLCSLEIAPYIILYKVIT